MPSPRCLAGVSTNVGKPAFDGLEIHSIFGIELLPRPPSTLEGLADEQALADIRRIDDKRKRVAKFVFSRPDAVSEETVAYRYHDYRTRTVICLRRRADAPVGCRIVAQAIHFVRSLSAEEIVSQPDHLAEPGRLLSRTKWAGLQIMFMSMGEPCSTSRACSAAIEELYAKYPKAALLISTSPACSDYSVVADVSRRILTVGLQFSSAKSTDAARDALIPFRQAHLG